MDRIHHQEMLANHQEMLANLDNGTHVIELQNQKVESSLDNTELKEVRIKITDFQDREELGLEKDAKKKGRESKSDDKNTGDKTKNHQPMPKIVGQLNGINQNPAESRNFAKNSVPLSAFSAYKEESKDEKNKNKPSRQPQKPSSATIKEQDHNKISR